MNYTALLKELYSLNRTSGIKLGLENIQKLDKMFGSPSKRFRSVHIAGTNGKGSVAHKISKSLEISGFRTGLYTSPHIASFRERIQTDSRMITEEKTAESLSEILDAARRHSIPATFFEAATMLAFRHFAEEEVDWAVVETGIGGRLDATNILRPNLCVITSISLDHTDILGDTIEQIALEKQGVLKEGVPAVIGPAASMVPGVSVEGAFSSYEEENQAIARKALELLDIEPHGIALRPPCRMEEFEWKGVKLFLDAGHNPEGLKQLFHALQREGETFSVICGLSSGKDLRNCLLQILPHAEKLYLVEAENGREASRERLTQELHALGRKEGIVLGHTPLETLDAAASDGRTVVICGSFFILHPFRKLLIPGIEEDPIDVNEPGSLGLRKREASDGRDLNMV